MKKQIVLTVITSIMFTVAASDGAAHGARFVEYPLEPIAKINPGGPMSSTTTVRRTRPERASRRAGNKPPTRRSAYRLALDDDTI